MSETLPLMCAVEEGETLPLMCAVKEGLPWSQTPIRNG
jgi:hypothetical protein